MNIKNCEKKEKNEAEMLVEVTAEEFETAVGEAFRKNRNKISVPGFRKGKAPRKIIERMYGASVFHSDALDIILPGVVDFAVIESGLKIVGTPQITDVDIPEDNGGITVTINAAMFPEIELTQYRGLSAYKPEVKAEDSEIEAEVDAVRLRNARIETVERPAATGDIAIIDFEGFIDGEPFEGGKDGNYELELGSSSFIPGFEDGVAGMSAGDERDIDLVFPDEYAEHLAGKPVVFKVKLNEVREKQLPDLDDEFAKDVSEFDTLAEYKDSIKEKLLKKKQEDADVAFEGKLMDKIVDSMDTEIPDVMVEEQMDVSMQNFARQAASYGLDPASYLQLMNTTPEVFRESMRKSSLRQVKGMLALEKIAELEGIEVSDEDIENEYQEASVRFKMEVDKIKETVDAEQIAAELKMRRATKVITDNAVALDREEDDADKTADKSEADKPAAKPRKTTAKKTAAEPAEEPATEAVAAETEPGGDDAAPEAKPKKAPAKAAAKKPKPEAEDKE